MHFHDITWLDFVRGLLTADEAWVMQQHLTVGCEECIKAHAFWTRMQDFTGQEVYYNPNQCDVGEVAESARIEMPEPIPSGNVTVAVLTFDSLRSATAAGFRGGLTQARYVIYAAGAWVIYLRIKSEIFSQFVLTGHITKTGIAPNESPGMEIILQNADSLLRSTRTNESGEFHLQYCSATSVRLFAIVSPQETLEVRLPAVELMTPR